MACYKRAGGLGIANIKLLLQLEIVNLTGFKLNQINTKGTSLDARKTQ